MSGNVVNLAQRRGWDIYIRGPKPKPMVSGKVLPMPKKKPHWKEILEGKY